MPASTKHPVMRLLPRLFALLLSVVPLAGQEISPWLFGQNHWMANHDEGTRPGHLHLLWPKVAESGVRLVRIGGNGYEKRFPERTRLRQIIADIRSAGAEPLLQVPHDFSAGQAAELVHDLNRKPGQGVRFWSIGNEPLLHDPEGIQKVYVDIIRIAPALRAADPSIRIFAFDEASMHTSDYEALCGGRFDVTGRNPDGTWMIDGFTFHRYPNGREFKRDDVILHSAENVRLQARSLVSLMAEADRRHQRTGEARLLWGLTELNVTYVNPDRDIAGFGNASFLGGQFVAEVFGIGMSLRAFTIAPWCINETDRVATDFGYLGLPPEFHPRSTYYHMQLMARHMTGSFLPSSTSDRRVKSIATRNAQGMAVMLLNQNKERDIDYELVFKPEPSLSGPLTVTVEAGLPARHTGRLPSQSTVLLLFDPKGAPMAEFIYDLRRNLGNLPPERRLLPSAADGTRMPSMTPAKSQ